MYTGTYERLNVHVMASTRTVLRAMNKKLKKSAFTRANRTARHALYREILACHKQARELYLYVQTGYLP